MPKVVCTSADVSSAFWDAAGALWLQGDQIWEAAKEDRSTLGDLVLDVGGMLPVIGFVFDAVKGNLTDAGMSASAAVPGLGDAVMLAK